jgi:hypothetical protein
MRSPERAVAAAARTKDAARIARIEHLRKSMRR